MNDDQLLRYSRQIMLPSIGIGGQEAMLKARVLIIGLGGLGAPVAMYLAAAGIGTLVLSDFDKVDLTNLQRQIIHNTETVGSAKVESARATIGKLNPECLVETLGDVLSQEALFEQIARADLVVDCTDNFSTRFAINEGSVKHQTPLVSGAAIRTEGQVSVFSGKPGDPCYRCLYGGDSEVNETCSENGVLAPVVGIIGSIQATEAIKVLTGAGTPLNGRLLMMDALEMQWRTLKLKADPNCPVCSGRE